MKKLILFFFVFLFAGVNEYREKVGLTPLKEDFILTQAALNHAKYLYYNHIMSHYEYKGYPYFTGVRPLDRVLALGYPTRFVVENISNGEDSFKESVDDLFSGIYHRFGFLDFNINLLGKARVGKFFVYDMSNSYLKRACQKEFRSYGFMGLCANKRQIISKKSYYKLMQKNPKVVLWPYPDMKNTPVVFYEEIPDPLPDYGVSGYPVTISFNPYYVKSVEVLSFNLYLNHKKIKTRLLTYTTDPNRKLKKTEFALFPLKRLNFNSKYDVKALFSVNGKKVRFSWSFYTDKEQNVLVVNGRQATFHVKSNTTYLIYFKPLNRFDKISRVSYFYLRGMRINEFRYKDFNSLYVNINGKGIFRIKTLKREVKLIVD